jgi:hypothetical protein
MISYAAVNSTTQTLANDPLFFLRSARQQAANAHLRHDPHPATRTDTAGQAGPSYLDQLLALLGSMGADVDVAFVVFAKQIQQLDNDINARVKGLDSLSKLTDVYNQELERVKNLYAAIANGKSNSDDNVDLIDLWQHMKGEHKTEDEYFKEFYPGVAVPDDDALVARALNHAIFNDPTRKQEVLDYYGLEPKRFDIDPTTGGVIAKGSGDKLGTGTGDGFRVTKADVEKREQAVKAELDKISTGRELATIGLNAVISKKGQIAQLLSNIQKKEHDTLTAIIGNLR